jgi:methyl-accepting chemotaxis protein
MAAAALSVSAQAADLVQAVAVFKLNGQDGMTQANAQPTAASTLQVKLSDRRIPNAKAAQTKPTSARALHRPTPTATTVAAKAGDNAHWETF